MVTKLTPAKVRAMRYLYWCKHIDQRCLARLYGYNHATIYDAVNYITWRQVADTFKADQIIRQTGDMRWMTNQP